MAEAINDQKTGWDARMERIRTGQTMTQIAEAKGTIPLQCAKESARKVESLRGVSAWVASATFDFGIATVIGRLDPESAIADSLPAGPISAPVQSFANPFLALLSFLLALVVLRVAGLLPRIAGIAILVEVLVVQADTGVPSLADLAEMTRSRIMGESTT